MSDDGGEVLRPVVTRLDLHPAAADLPNTVEVEGKEQSASRRWAKHSGARGVVCVRGCQLQLAMVASCASTFNQQLVHQGRVCVNWPSRWHVVVVLVSSSHSFRFSSHTSYANDAVVPKQARALTMARQLRALQLQLKQVHGVQQWAPPPRPRPRL